MQIRFKLAIDLGRKRMQASQDPDHDLVHIEEVIKHALKSYHSLQKDGKINNPLITPELVEIACWWHDTYKALNAEQTLKDVVIEGEEAAKITKPELKTFLGHTELELVCNAIRYHNVPWLYIFKFFYPRKLTPLGVILIEADSLEIFRNHRSKVYLQNHPQLSAKIFLISIICLKIFTMPLFMQSKYTWQYYWKHWWEAFKFK